MRKGAGLALLAIASLYQLKRNRDRANAHTVETVKKEQKTRKSPIQALIEAKLKQEAVLNIKAEEVEVEIPLETPELTEELVEEVETPKETEETEDAQETKEQDESETATVYIVGKGKKYHLNQNCRGIKKDSELTELTLDDALEKGFTLCGWEDK